MANGKFPIEKQTFIEADERTYRSLEYDMFSHIWECGSGVEKRVAKLEKRKLWDSTLSGITGIIGGFFAVIMKSLWLR